MGAITLGGLTVRAILIGVARSVITLPAFEKGPGHQFEGV